MWGGEPKLVHTLASMTRGVPTNAKITRARTMYWIDPLSLSSTEGAVERFMFNAQGDADGFLLANGQQVHFPPHLSDALLKRVKLGDHVRVRGLKPRAADVLVGLSLTTQAGQTIEDSGSAALHQTAHRITALKSKHVKHVGVVKRCLYAPRGEVCGALLVDGCILRMHPEGNEKLLHFLKPGSELTVWGDQIRVKGQLVIDIAYLASV
jgi:hypothetical protein